MQSKIKSDFEIKTYYPSWKDMGQFAKFVEKIEGECQGQCGAKIVPPTRFKADSKEVDENMVLSHVMVQRAEIIKIKNGTAYELSSNQQEMTYKQFITNAKDYNIIGKSDEAMEELAWQQLETGRLTTYYAVDIDMSLFGDKCERMNLNKFTRAESLLHQGSVQLGGIHTPLAYFGSHLTYFGLHLEDENANSINYLHRGERKIWYFVPESENKKIETLANKFGEKVRTTCNNFIRHKTLMIPPTVLRKNNIKFGRVVQNPNEFILSFSGGYHAGFNCGLNQAEAINFGTTRWLRFYPDFLACHCDSGQEEFMVQLRRVFAGIYASESKKWKIKKSFSCDICKKSFSTRGSIRTHMKSQHFEMIPRFICPVCNEQFTRKGCVNVHLKSHHGTKRGIIKLVMVKNLSFGKSLPGIKDKRRTFTCHECGMVIQSAYGLKRHIKTKHEKRNSLTTRDST